MTLVMFAAAAPNVKEGCSIKATVASNVRRLRRVSELTQGDLASLAQVGVATIQRIEDSKEPSWSALWKVAGALDVQLADLFVPCGETS